MSSQRSCRWVKSGSTRSTPGWCSSGKSTPQSMISSRPSYSSTAMLRPISPTPPSGMTRRKPDGSGGGSSSNGGTRPTLLSRRIPARPRWSTDCRRAHLPSRCEYDGPARAGRAQRSFDELGRPLRDITFTVVDLETTGGSAEAGSMITEIGAVKVRGGEVLGEFQTLVNPHTEIPPFIAVLTGISNAMVADAPPIESALPAFLEFAAGHRPGRPQRAVRRRLPQALQRAAGPGAGRGSRSSTPPSWRAG